MSGRIATIFGVRELHRYLRLDTSGHKHPYTHDAHIAISHIPMFESRSKPIIFHCVSTVDGLSPRKFSARVLLAINRAGIESRDT